MSLLGQIKRYWIEFAAVGALVVIAVPVALYIVSNQRLTFPWEDRITIKAEFSSAQSAAPGQGQTVTISGVKVGEISKVEVEEGQAVVSMELDPGELKGPIYSNATTYLRPRTGLNDMTIQLDPGTKAAGGELKDGDTVPASNTIPNVNPDEVLETLDVDSRRYLAILLNAGGRGFKDRGKQLREVLKASQPALERTNRVTRVISDRRVQLRRLITSLRRLSRATAAKDDELASLIKSSAAVFGAIGEREAEFHDAIRRLPRTLAATREALNGSRVLADELGPASTALRPVARELGPALEAARPLLRDATPILRDDLRPLVRETQPLLRELTPPLKRVSSSTPELVRVGKVLNYVANEIAYNPPGKEEGFLFWSAWFNHNAASILRVEDAHGVAWRGLLMVGCSSAGQIAAQIPILAPFASSAVCPSQP